MSNFFYSLISFVVALFFILAGVIGLMLPWSPGVRTDLVQFILEDSYLFFIFGTAFVLIGLAIVINVILGIKKRYYHIKSGQNTASLDESLFQQYVDIYWKQLFPNQEVPNRVELKKNKVHITADLPYVPVAQQKSLIHRIENDLGALFSQYLGYKNEYLLSISFQSEKRA